MLFDGPYVIVGTRRISKALGISRPTLYKLIDSGELPIRKLTHGRRGAYATTYGLIDEWIKAGWIANRNPSEPPQATPGQALPEHPQAG